jgi:hypothetical protein
VELGLMADYDLEARDDAILELGLIADGGSGQVAVLNQPATAGTFDPATDTTTGGSPPQTHTGSGVELAYRSQSIDGKLILIGDIRFLLSPVKDDGTDMPEPVADSWTLTLGARTLTIKRVDPLRPAGRVVMYELQLRA